jgi:hypothetical protein
MARILAISFRCAIDLDPDRLLLKSGLVLGGCQSRNRENANDSGCSPRNAKNRFHWMSSVANWLCEQVQIALIRSGLLQKELIVQGSRMAREVECSEAAYTRSPEVHRAPRKVEQTLEAAADCFASKASKLARSPGSMILAIAPPQTGVTAELAGPVA